MVKISNEMISMVKDQLPILATSNKNRDPQLIPKGSLHVYDTEHLIYYEHTFKQAYNNILENDSKVAVAVINEQEQKGFLFEGIAEIMRMMTLPIIY